VESLEVGMAKGGDDSEVRLDPGQLAFTCNGLLSVCAVAETTETHLAK
jgi:hypothetical protein